MKFVRIVNSTGYCRVHQNKHDPQDIIEMVLWVTLYSSNPYPKKFNYV